MLWVFLFFLFIYFLNVLSAISIIFRERKESTAVWAWLMVLFFLPLVGLLIYLLIGRELKKCHWNERTLPYAASLLETQQKAAYMENLSQQSFFPKRFLPIVELHLHYSNAPLIPVDNMEIFTDGIRKMSSLLNDIEAAETSIHLQYYGIDKDESSRKLIQLLAEKAQSGVDVWVLYDALGSKSVDEDFFAPLHEAGGKTAAFFPLRYSVFHASVNHRNHRKIAVIDRSTAYVGGFNIGKKFLTGTENLGYWRDSHLRLTGDAVLLLEDHFKSDWSKSAPAYPNYLEEVLMSHNFSGDTAMQVVPSGPDTENNQIKNGFLKFVQQTESYLYIQTPYFVPDKSFLESLRVAIMSGVDVRIMVPSKADELFVNSATSFFTGELLKAGASIYIYDKGFLHAKTVVADDFISSLGTTNIDIRSFRLNYEINAFMYGEKTAKKMKEIFLEDADQCRVLTLKEYEKRSWFVRVKEELSRLLSPLL